MPALELLLQDFLLGEHLLLVGNQGVGKNMLADRLLQLLNRPHEYIQLHRLAFCEVPVHNIFVNF
jgi:MoxR-like ATPase